MISITLPIHTVSEANRRDHWRVKAKRVKSQRKITAALVPRFGLPCVVTLVRVGVRPLDEHDNLRSALKGVVDSIADRLGVPDNDPRIEWRYGQAKGTPAVLVTLEAV
jgi:hypothetical protein